VENAKVIAVYLTVLGLTGVFLLVAYWFIWAALSIAGLIILVAWHKKIGSHKILSLGRIEHNLRHYSNSHLGNISSHSMEHL